MKNVTVAIVTEDGPGGLVRSQPRLYLLPGPLREINDWGRRAHLIETNRPLLFDYILIIVWIVLIGRYTDWRMSLDYCNVIYTAQYL